MVNGQMIKEWVEKSGLSKEAFAVRIGASLGTVQNLFKGKPVKIETLQNVAEAMGVQMEDLIADRKAG